MDKNISLTFIAVFADVSMNSKLFSSAYSCASYVDKGICNNEILS